MLRFDFVHIFKNAIDARKLLVKGRNLIDIRNLYVIRFERYYLGII